MGGGWNRFRWSRRGGMTEKRAYKGKTKTKVREGRNKEDVRLLPNVSRTIDHYVKALSKPSTDRSPNTPERSDFNKASKKAIRDRCRALEYNVAITARDVPTLPIIRIQVESTHSFGIFADYARHR